MSSNYQQEVRHFHCSYLENCAPAMFTFWLWIKVEGKHCRSSVQSSADYSTLCTATNSNINKSKYVAEKGGVRRNQLTNATIGLDSRNLLIISGSQFSLDQGHPIRKLDDHIIVSRMTNILVRQLL